MFIGLKKIKMRLKDNPIYLILKSYDIGEGGGKFMTVKYLEAFGNAGAGRVCYPSVCNSAIVISKYKLSSSEYVCIHCQHCYDADV